jgi:Zn-dependent protease with chaperone function
VSAFCVNCGQPVADPGRLCPACWADPLAPLEPMRRRIAAVRPRSSPTRDEVALRDPDETAALTRAILLSGLLALVVAGLTLGFFALLLGLSVLSVLATMRSIAGQSVEVRSLRDRRLGNLVAVACARLAVPMPPVYVRQDPSLNAFTMGLGPSNIVVLHSGLVRQMPPDEILFVVGHELGHVRFGHATWSTLTSPLRLHPLFWVGAVVGLFFNGWSLRAEYTADRAGLLAVRDARAAVSALVRVTTGAGAEQVGEPAPVADGSDGAIGRLVEQLGTHPFLAHRVRAVREFSRDHAELVRGFADRLAAEAAAV